MGYHARASSSTVSEQLCLGWLREFPVFSVGELGVSAAVLSASDRVNLTGPEHGRFGTISCACLCGNFEFVDL